MAEFERIEKVSYLRIFTHNINKRKFMISCCDKHKILNVATESIPIVTTCFVVCIGCFVAVFLYKLYLIYANFFTHSFLLTTCQGVNAVVFCILSSPLVPMHFFN